MRFGTLVLKAASLGALVAATAWAMARAPGDPADTYIQAVADKQRRLQSLGRGKLVLIGGSSTAFNVDSALLERRVGRPVVNMGLQAGMGLRLMLAQVRPFVGRGDAIVIAPEYHVLARKPALSSTACQALSYLPRTPGITPVERARCELIASVERAQSTFKYNAKRLLGIQTRYDAFTRAAFNERGDFTAHLRLGPRPHLLPTPVLKVLDQDTLELLGEFAAEAEGRGACVYLAYPAFADFAYRQHRDTVVDIDVRLRRRLPQATFLGAPHDFLLPRPMLFDSVYHATAPGRAIHTERLANGLAAVGGCRAAATRPAL